MDYSKYLGTWVGTLEHGHTIAQFKLYEENGALMMETETTGNPKHWGSTLVYPFSSEKDTTKLSAFEARYELNIGAVHLCVNANKGLLIVAGFHHMKPESGKKPFCTREFFYKLES